MYTIYMKTFGLEHHRGENGNMAEGDFFGYVDKEKHRDELKRIADELKADPTRAAEMAEMHEALNRMEPPYKPMAASLELVRLCQKQVPTLPEKEFAKALRREVWELVALEFKQKIGAEIKNSDVKFYTACSDWQNSRGILHTTADRFHDTDAFLEFDIAGERIIVTIDGSINTNKHDKKSRANVVMIWPTDLDSATNPLLFRNFVIEQARKVVEVVREKWRYKHQ